MTLVVVCDNVSDYSEQVTILADDIPSSTSDHYVQVGDVVTIDNLIASAVIVSDNPAAQALARVVGYKINPSAADDNAARSAFYAAMNAKASELGMINTTYGGAAWVGGNSTAADQCTLLREIYNNYPKITSYWGLLNYTMTITGSNARTYQITSTVSSADRNVIPEFVGGKTGTGNNLGNLAFVWSYNNDYYTTIIFQASPVNYRVKDAAQAIAETKELI
jgi:D-alanyl-D-alanine carboxypeptidase